MSNETQKTWHNLMRCSSLQGLRSIMKKLREQFPGVNPGPSDYEAGILTTRT